jgi:hypothetical protein
LASKDLYMEQENSFTKAHLDNQLWLNELRFYRDETEIFQKHLEELIERNTSLQESDDTVFFQNQFARIGDLVTNMENELQSAQTKMAMYAKSDQSAVLEDVIVADHYLFRDTITGFKEEYEALKNKFKRFETELY